MAAGLLRLPGTQYGPCYPEDCDHVRCIETRTMAKEKCPLCLMQISYARRYYNDPVYGLVHAACLEQKLGV